MRQSLAEIEDAFAEQIAYERTRRERLRHEAALRSRQRGVERVQRRGKLHFTLLAIALVLTAVIVTVVMFETLYIVMA
jgi:hypothetical protein